MKLTDEQITILKKSGVKLVYLFGSLAEGKNMKHSDVDVGIVPEYSIGKKAVLTDLYNGLYDLFTDVFPGKNIDIVFLNRASLELRFDVITHGKIIYTESKDDRFDFEEKTMLHYADFRPLLDEFNEAVLGRIR